MKWLFMFWLGFIMLTEFQGGYVWVKPEDIKMIYREPEGARVILDSCGELLVEETPEEVIAYIEQKEPE